MNSKEKLRALMKRGDFTYLQTADFLGVSVWTVKAWLYPDTCKAALNPPDNMLELFELKLNARKTK